MDLGRIGRMLPSSRGARSNIIPQALHFMKTIKEVAYEDYDIRYRSKNKWEYLGCGRVEAEIKHDLENLTPYMRNSDVPWEIK